MAKLDVRLHRSAGFFRTLILFMLVLSETSITRSFAFVLNCCPCSPQQSAEALLLLRTEEACGWPGVKSCHQLLADHTPQPSSSPCLSWGASQSRILSLQDYIAWGERVIRGKLVLEKSKS